MKNKLIFGSLLLATSAGAIADYQMEVNAGLGFGEDDQKTAGASLSVYFEEVDTSKGPLREAAFLDKASSVTISGSSDTPNRNGFESFDASVLGRVVLESDLIIEAGGGQAGDENFATFGMGTYVTDDWDILFNYERNTSTGSEYYTVKMHGYVPLSGDRSLGFNGKVGLGSAKVSSDNSGNENGAVLGADLTYYANKSLGFTLGFEDSNLDFIDTTTMYAKAEYFINESYAVSVNFNTIEINDESSDLFSINATARF